ncbi:MAG: hypothetical protein R6X35_15150 [Candidatus Krumholzibacteriia bacterium]
MAKKIPALIQLSTAELKRLLAARERIDVLEQEQASLLKSLAAVEAELGRLLAGAAGGTAKPAARRKSQTVKKATRKAARRKTTKKKTTKKTTKKKTAKKTAGKPARKTAKKTAKKTARKPASRSSRKTAPQAGGKVRLEDVIVAVLERAGGTLPFKDLYAAIVDGKLFRTKAGNFDNVLRRTLSTSKAVKRAGRGIYTVA